MKRSLCLLACAVVACRPDFGERESRVDREQVLAVLIEPPEARPGDTVTASLVVASPSGPVAASAGWAYCAADTLLTENGATAASCLTDNGVVPVSDVAVPSVMTPLPAMGCFTFGPETQSADLRPRDPDVTGGYFAPLRAQIGQPDGSSLFGYGFARLTCNLANANADQVTIFEAQYVANKNPVLLPLAARLVTGEAMAFDSVLRGAPLVLRAAWRPEDAESYALLDQVNQVVVTRRESLRVSWFATDGDFDHDRTGRTEDELDTFTDNAWTAPSAGTSVHLWAVLRDSRGGTSALHVPVTLR